MGPAQAGRDYEYESWDDSDKKLNDELYAWVNNHLGPIVYFCGSVNLLRELSRGPCKLAIWHKPWAMTHSGIGNGTHHWEPIILRNIAKGAYLPVDVISQNTDREPGLRDKHSCPKPVALFAHLIESMFPDGDVTDCFCGSGTTIIASEKIGRTAHGIEIDCTYCDVIVERWQNLTGQKARRG